MPKLKLAVAYIRMSTDKQEDSPARQRAEIERYAKEHGYKIIEWYEDHGKTGTTSNKRKDFQRLMKDARSGRFQFVLMYEQSRFSREDMLQFAHHLYELRECGVTLVTTLKGVIETNDIGGMLLTLIESYKSRSESETIAHRSTSGKRRKFVEGEDWLGRALFGFDRVYTGHDGTVRRIPYLERYQRSHGERCHLAPSTDSAAVAAVHWAFQAVLNGTSLRDIALEFNARGLTTFSGNTWKRQGIAVLLRNPAYCGRRRIGAYCNGKFCRMTDDIIIRENAHEGIVSPEVFDAVQRILNVRLGTRRERVPGSYLLTRRLTCGHCGSVMRGQRSPERTRGGRVEAARTTYRCQDYESLGTCQRGIDSRPLEGAVLNAIQREMLDDGNLRRAVNGYWEQRQMQAGESPVSGRMVELQQKIDRATERLAGDALDSEEFAAVCNMRRAWRDELKQLRRASRRQFVAQSIHDPLTPEQSRQCAENLELADRCQLQELCDALIESVTLWRTGPHENRASLVLNPAYYFGGPIELTDEDIHPDRLWRRVCRIVVDAGQPLTNKEVGERIDGIHNANVHRCLKRGVQAGMIQRFKRAGRILYGPADS